MGAKATQGISSQSWAKSLVIFCAHQIIGTWGIPIFAYSLGNSIFEMFRMFSVHPSFRHLHWILTETPYYPVQVALGLWFGWMLNRRLGHGSMVWIWVLPFLILSCVLIAFPTFTTSFQSVMQRGNSGQPSLSYYLGWGCQPKNHCLDQLAITMPFYTAAAYSIGAALARKSSQVRSVRALSEP